MGIAEYLEASGDIEWLAANRAAIARTIGYVRGFDFDNDGLIESPRRLGISGEHQWSTSWFDVISFGWKDAYVNAILHEALCKLDRAFAHLNEEELASGLEEWANRLREHYRSTFFNDETGWLAGWRCKNDQLHDYAFLFVNGAAINAGLLEPGDAREIMERLYREMATVGVPDARLGLPGNLWPVASFDYALGDTHPFPTYENGGLTHSQSRHFVGALFKVGMTREADILLEKLCATLGDGTAFAGCGSGVDWRRWDGSATGYEGFLCDQFGIVALAIDRYRAD